MRYRNDHRFHSHRRLVAAAASLAKANGFAATPVREMAAAAACTTGTLYSLLDTKENLLRSIIEQELERTLLYLGGHPPPGTPPIDPLLPGIDAPAASWAPATAAEKQRALHAALAAYLHPAHLHDHGGGCVLPALAAEIARADQPTRRACERGLRQLHAHLGRLLDDRAAAWAVLSQAVGALLLARTMESAEAGEEVLTSALQDATRRHPGPPPPGPSHRISR